MPFSLHTPVPVFDLPWKSINTCQLTSFDRPTYRVQGVTVQSFKLTSFILQVTRADQSTNTKQVFSWTTFSSKDASGNVLQLPLHWLLESPTMANPSC